MVPNKVCCCALGWQLEEHRLQQKGKVEGIYTRLEDACRQQQITLMHLANERLLEAYHASFVSRLFNTMTPA